MTHQRIDPEVARRYKAVTDALSILTTRRQERGTAEAQVKAYEQSLEQRRVTLATAQSAEHDAERMLEDAEADLVTYLGAATPILIDVQEAQPA